MTFSRNAARTTFNLACKTEMNLRFSKCCQTWERWSSLLLDLHEQINGKGLWLGLCDFKGVTLVNGPREHGLVSKWRPPQKKTNKQPCVYPCSPPRSNQVGLVSQGRFALPARGLPRLLKVGSKINPNVTRNPPQSKTPNAGRVFFLRVLVSGVL